MAGVGKSPNEQAMNRWYELFLPTDMNIFDYPAGEAFRWWVCMPSTLFPAMKDGEALGYDYESVDDKEERCRRNFERVWALAFDCPFPDLLYWINLRDHLWLPETDKRNTHMLNAWQLFGLESKQRDPILSTLHYLFSDHEPYYDEKYGFHREELAARALFYKRIRERYASATDYVDRVWELLHRPRQDALCFVSAVEMVDAAVKWPDKSN